MNANPHASMAVTDPKVMSQIQVGDVFQMEVAPGQFAYGRIMSSEAVGFLTEIFDRVDGGGQPEEAIESKRMFRPFYLSISSYRKAGWTLASRDSDYDGDDRDQIGFVLGRDGAGGVRVRWPGERKAVLSEAEADGMEELVIHASGRVMYMVREHLDLL